MKKSVLTAFSLMFYTLHAGAEVPSQAAMEKVIEPLMTQWQVPGMAVAVSVNGKAQFYNYGVASKTSKQPVTQRTLFEIGSLSKTFTATLAQYAADEGKLNFTDPASRYLPALSGSAFDRVTLLQLATHTAGTPLFVPDDVTTTPQLIAWYKAWQPPSPPGTTRVYSNLGIGLLGMITAHALNQPFSSAMENQMLPALGLHHSFITVPPVAMPDYAQGYNKEDKPVRVTPGPLDAESYGLKSSSGDLIRYLEINLGQHLTNGPWREAVQKTHTGYVRAGEFTQALMWEFYPLPVDEATLLAGNDSARIMKGVAAQSVTNPQAPVAAWYNKTGSTNGFSSYAVFIPSRNIAVILLANKWYPNDARVKAAWDIVQGIDEK